jgi:hypothetical protein
MDSTGKGQNVFYQNLTPTFLKKLLPEQITSWGEELVLGAVAVLGPDAIPWLEKKHEKAHFFFTDIQRIRAPWVAELAAQEAAVGMSVEAMEWLLEEKERALPYLVWRVTDPGALASERQNCWPGLQWLARQVQGPAL